MQCLDESLNTANIDWTLPNTIALIRLLASHSCLWNCNDADYHSPEMQHAALLDITAALNYKYNQAQLLQKLFIIKLSYCHEKRCIRQRMRQGLGAKTELSWFAIADSFLKRVPKHMLLKNMNLTKSCNFNSFAHLLKLEYQQSHAAWTAQHSMQFLQLLKQQDCLWQLPIDSQQQHAALGQISLAMHWPCSILKQKLLLMLKTWQQEQEKATQMLGSYKAPSFVWWSEFENIMQSCQTLNIENPIKQEPNIEEHNDLNLSTEYMHVPENNDDNNFDEQLANAYTPLNPIASVAPASVMPPSVQQAMQDLFYDNLHNLPEDDEDAEQLSCSNGDSTGLKLIWNGLEDDLLEGKWSLKHSVKFLRLYGAHRCLWDLKHASYRSRELRQAAIEDIAAAMGYGLNADYVTKKIKIFRITYMQHRKRMLASIKEGKQPEIQLKWFPLADSFLRPHIGLRSIKETDNELPQFDYHYVYANLNLIDPMLLNDFRRKESKNC